MVTMVVGWRELLHSFVRPLQVFHIAYYQFVKFSIFCEFTLIFFSLVESGMRLEEAKEKGEEGRRRGGRAERRKTALIF